MRGMILAAGKGTRLLPLTKKTPKPLISVLGIPLIRHGLNRFKESGVKDVIVNLSYLKNDLKKYLAVQSDMHISFSIEKKLLGTGGGIQKTRPFFKQKPFVVMNCDMLMNIDLKKVIAYHTKKRALATMVVKRASVNTPKDYISLNGKNKIIALKKKSHHASKKVFFTGIHIFDPKIFDFFPKNRKEFCIVQDVYAPLIKKGLPIYGYPFRGDWYDCGKLSSYLKYHKDYLTLKQWLHFRSNLRKLFPGVILPKTL